MADEKKFNPVYANPSTQYTSAYPFSSIVFPENVPVMAADLNEMQKNFGSKLGDVIKTLSGSSITSGNMTWVPVKQEYKQCVRKITEDRNIPAPYGNAGTYTGTFDIKFGWYNADISGFLLINGSVYGVNVHVPKFVREDVEISDYISHFQEDMGLDLASGDTVSFEMFPDTGSISSWKLEFSSPHKTNISGAVIESTNYFPYGRTMPENPLKFNAYLVLDEVEFTAEDAIPGNISQETYPLTTASNVSASISNNNPSALANYLADNDFAEEIARRKGLKQVKVVITGIDDNNAPNNGILIFSDGNWVCESANSINAIQDEYKNAVADLNKLAVENKKAWFLSDDDWRSLSFSAECINENGILKVRQNVNNESFSFPMLIMGAPKIVTIKSAEYNLSEMADSSDYYNSDTNSGSPFNVFVVQYVTRGAEVRTNLRDSLYDEEVAFILWYVILDQDKNIVQITDTTTVKNDPPYYDNHEIFPAVKTGATLTDIYTCSKYNYISKDGKSFGPKIIDASYTGVKKEPFGENDFRNVRVMFDFAGNTSNYGDFSNKVSQEHSNSLLSNLFLTMLNPTYGIVRQAYAYGYKKPDYKDASSSYLPKFNSSEVFLSLNNAYDDNHQCISIDSGNIRYKLSTPDKIKYQTFDDSGVVTSEVITSRSSVVSVSCDSFLQSTSDSTTIKGVSVPSGAWYLTVPCGCIQGTKREIVISDVCFDGIENDSDAYTALLNAYSCVTRVSSTQKGEIIIICSGDKPDINIKIRVAAMYGTDN